MIWRIREMLGLERETIAEMIDGAAFASDAAVQEVSGVELDSRLGGGNFHGATSRRLDDACREHQRIRSGPATIEHEVVVVSVAEANLGVLSLIDSLANRVWRPEIEGRPL